MGSLRSFVTALASLAFVMCLRAGDPLPSRSVAPDGRGYTSAVAINATFPESSYGLTHNGSSFYITPATSPFGQPDHSIGSFYYQVNPFYPRNSEGVYEMEVWLERQAGDGSWSAVDTNSAYWRIDTPNPGPSGSNTFYLGTLALDPNTPYRVFGYVYMYNQGGSNQGAFPLSSTIGPVNTGTANDAPRVGFSTSGGILNPTQITVGQSYKIEAFAEDDNKNLSVVRIWKNGTPFAFNPVSDYSGTSSNYTSDNNPGIVTFTAQAEDTSGAVSSTETWTVTILDRSDQPGISSANAGITLGQSFTPVYNGGAGSGGWQFVVAGQTNWDGSASSNTGTQLGNGTWSSSWTPAAAGTYTFYVSRNGDSNYKASNIAGPYTLTVYGTPTVSWISTPPAQVPPGTALQWSAQASSPNVPASSIELHFDISTDGGNSWVGNAYQFANNTNSNVVTAGPSGTTYLMRATVNDGTIGSNGFVSAIYNSVTVSASVQTVSLSPTNPTVTAGDPITLTATGGQNGYIWGGNAAGSGSTQTLTFNAPGSYVVTVYSPAGGAFGQSNIASTTVNVVAASQSVSVTPTDPSIIAGQSVTFTASGGNNGYVWSGTPGSNGTSQTVTFNSPGTFTITVYSPAGGIFGPSNTATTTVTVYATPTASITATPSSGVAPLTTTINWSSTSASSVGVSGPGLSASSATGSQNVTLGAGSHVFTISVSGPGGSASASVTVTVATNTATLNLSSSNVSFGSVYRDSQAGSPTSATRNVTLSNPGNASVTLTGLSTSGPFSITSGLTLPFVISAGGSASVTLSFGPAAPTGASTGVLTATASTNTATANLSGTGLAPRIGVSWR